MKNKKEIYFNRLPNGIKILPCDEEYFKTLWLEENKGEEKMNKEIEKYYLTLGDIQKLYDCINIDIITKDNRHIQLIRNDEMDDGNFTPITI